MHAKKRNRIRETIDEIRVTMLADTFNESKMIIIDVAVKNVAYKATRIVEMILPNKDNPSAIAFERFFKILPISNTYSQIIISAS